MQTVVLDKKNDDVFFLTGSGGLMVKGSDCSGPFLYRQQFANQRHRLFDGDRLVGQLYEDGVNVAELFCVFHASPA